jgi:hypothetical protein
MDCPDGGWEGYTVWPNQPSTADITKLVATWQVPQAPTNQQDQFIFIFIGLESISELNAPGGILQPVLQWTNGPNAGANAGWFIRSWYVTAEFDPSKYPRLPNPNSAVDQANLANENRCYSLAVPVNSGDMITGSIQGGKDANGKYNYTCSLLRNGQPTNTVLQLNDIPKPVYAVCAVESYNITVTPRSQDYPAAPITLSSIDLQVQNNSMSPIQWVASKNNLDLDFDANPMMGGAKVEFKLA